MPHEDELKITRKPLHMRKRPVASDVADAIEHLEHAASTGLPVAFTRADVLDQLIRIHLTQDDGTQMKTTAGMKEALREIWSNLLQNSSTFQAGYKHFEKRSQHPIVPVTDFFFKAVFGGGAVADCLDAMSDLEIRQSLPKRTTSMTVDDNGGSELIEAGQVAGIVVFPENSNANLLRAWLKRLASSTQGSMDRSLQSLTNARPGSPEIENLREQMSGLKPAMTKALPEPKAK